MLVHTSLNRSVGRVQAAQYMTRDSVGFSLGLVLCGWGGCMAGVAARLGRLRKVETVAGGETATACSGK